MIRSSGKFSFRYSMLRTDFSQWVENILTVMVKEVRTARMGLRP